MTIFAGCPLATTIPILATVTHTLNATDDYGVEVVANGGTATIECNGTLYEVGIGNDTSTPGAVTLTCTNGVWDDVHENWQCIPTCEI